MAELDRNLVRETQPRPAAAPKQKWTVMVYLAGDNNLTANCISVLQQLEAVDYQKYGDSVCVLACFDSNTPWPKGSRYLAINCRRVRKNNGLDWEIHNDLIPPVDRGHAFTPPTFCPGNTNGEGGEPMKRPDVAVGLSRFIKWAMNSQYNLPSERYMLILYGHGPVVAGSSFLARENPPSSLRLLDLKGILQEHFGKDKPKLDILACQNCVMNGIETAYEVQDQVKYMIGSQGLVLASGWPYERILSSLVKDPDATTANVARNLLKACARNLLDFAVMDRSSEQSACNLERFGNGHAENGENIVTAIKDLSNALREGLEFHDNQADGLKYPLISDLIKLARLEAQSYWAEVFADVYDFCERLLKKCNEAVIMQTKLLTSMGYDGEGSAFEKTDLLQILRKIIEACIKVTQEIEGTKREDGSTITSGIVEQSYFIGSDLQYSHGLSIFFPWTMPTEPYFFTKKGDADWVLKTAFETYRSYGFAGASAWAEFLVDFYKATLRKVRRSDRDFFVKANGQLADGIVGEQRIAPNDVMAIDLQKSSSDTGATDHDVWSTVKNYPRRNYLSPSDCARRTEEPGRLMRGSGEYSDGGQPPVSYLGWNISGLVAEVVRGSAEAPQTGNGNRAEVEVAVAYGAGTRETVAAGAVAADPKGRPGTDA